MALDRTDQRPLWHSSNSHPIVTIGTGSTGPKASVYECKSVAQPQRLTAPSSARRERRVEVQRSHTGQRCAQHGSRTPVSISPLQFIILIHSDWLRKYTQLAFVLLKQSFHSDVISYHLSFIKSSWIICA